MTHFVTHCLSTLSVSAKVKQLKVADVLNIMASGFVRGGSGFLKQSGEMIKGTGQINREVRVGVTHVSLKIRHVLARNDLVSSKTI